MIDDQEIGALFRDESEEHLKNLEDGLLCLETDPTNSAVLKEMYRSAHSLKGAARMLDIHPVEAVGHYFEDLLGSAAGGNAPLAPATIERLYRALDAVRLLVQEAVTGEDANVDVPLLLAGLGSQTTPPDASIVNVAPEAENAGEPTPQDPAPTTSLAPPVREVAPGIETEALVKADPATRAELASLPAISAWKIETIRVEPTKLDGLLTMAGDLVVTTTRANRGLSEIEAATTLWEEWKRAAAASQRALGEPDKTDNRLAPETSRELRLAIEREAEHLEQFGLLLARLRGALADVGRLQHIANYVEQAIHNVRLLPLSTVFQLFTRTVRDLSKAQQKQVRFIVEGGETAADKRVLEEIKDPLMHLIRNAIDHGIEPPEERERAGKAREATLRLHGYSTAMQIIIELQDDGRGLNTEAIWQHALRKGIVRQADYESFGEREVQELIFAPGFSTAAQVTDVSGRGVGLDVVRANVERLRGSVDVESIPGRGCLFRLALPVTLATSRVLLVRLQKHTYALPVEAVQSVQHFTPDALLQLKGRHVIAPEGKPIPLERLHTLLKLQRSVTPAESLISLERGVPCVILDDGSDRIALLVDELLDEQEIMLKPLDSVLRRVRGVSGATILDNGEVCLVLNPYHLIKTALLHKQHAPGGEADSPSALEPETDAPRTVLLVEDSITTRTQEKRILESAGYQVVTAVDGIDGWHKLCAGEFDAVISDVEMPNLNGLDLAARIRQHEKYQEIPIILVTSLASEADRRRGLEVGADAYITKGSFDQNVLLDTLRKFV